MKLEPEDIREAYRTEIQRRFGALDSEFAREALSVLETIIGQLSVNSTPEQSSVGSDTLVEVLSKPEYLHYCFGKPGKQIRMEWTAFKFRGDISHHPDVVEGYISHIDRFCRKVEFEEYQRLEEEHKKSGQQGLYFDGHEEKQKKALVLKQLEDLWDRRLNYREHNFEAKVFGERIGRSYVFSMYYFDNTNDTRPVYVAYALLIPESKIAEMVPIITDNPSILIESFRKAYPGFDNSNGTLRILEGPENRQFKDIPTR